MGSVQAQCVLRSQATDTEELDDWSALGKGGRLPDRPAKYAEHILLEAPFLHRGIKC